MNKYDRMINNRYNRLQLTDCPIKKQKIRDEIKELQQKSWSYNFEQQEKQSKAIAKKISKLKKFKAIHIVNTGGFSYSQEVEAEVNSNWITFYGARGFKESINLEALGGAWQFEGKDTITSNHSKLQILDFSIKA